MASEKTSYQEVEFLRLDICSSRSYRFTTDKRVFTENVANYAQSLFLLNNSELVIKTRY